MEVMLVIRDSYGVKLYEIVRLNGTELFDWLKEHDICLGIGREQSAVSYML